jgi:hypothetical protein
LRVYDEAWVSWSRAGNWNAHQRFTDQVVKIALTLMGGGGVNVSLNDGGNRRQWK